MQKVMFVFFLLMGSLAFGSWDDMYRGTAQIKSTDGYCTPYECKTFGIDVKRTKKKLLVRRKPFQCVCQQNGKDKSYWAGAEFELLFSVKNEDELWLKGKQVGSFDEETIEYSAFKTTETYIEKTEDGLSYSFKGKDFEFLADLE